MNQTDFSCKNLRQSREPITLGAHNVTKHMEWKPQKESTIYLDNLIEKSNPDFFRSRQHSQLNEQATHLKTRGTTVVS